MVKKIIVRIISCFIPFKRQRKAFRNKYIKEEAKAINGWCAVFDKNYRNISYIYKKKLSNFKIPQIPEGAYIKFNIQKALELKPGIKRIGWVIFNGIGDYFLCTAFIEQIKKEFPNLVFDAYVSVNKDGNCNPSIKTLLEVNPNFDKIYTFDGSSDDKYFKNFHFNKVYDTIDRETLILPLIYDFSPNVRSRHINLCQNYSITPPVIASKPVIYTDYDFSKAAENLLESIKTKYSLKNYKGIVWLALDSVCFQYHYPYNKELISLLIQAGYFVISTDKNDSNVASCVTIDKNVININNSIKLLYELNNMYDVSVLCFASCFYIISAGFNIPCLCVQFVYDPMIEAVSNVSDFVITPIQYPCLPITRQFVIGDKYYVNDPDRPWYANYKPEVILDCFNYMKTDNVKKMSKTGMAVERESNLAS